MAKYGTALLLEDFSLEITAKDASAVRDAASLIPHGTRINITYLGHESVEQRLAAAAAISAAGFVPVPHIAARRLASSRQIEGFLGALDTQGVGRHLFVIGGDPEQPEGPFADAFTLLRADAFQHRGGSDVSIAGYPEGHPQISEDMLWHSLVEKVALLDEREATGSIITQFGFDVDPVIEWINKVRARGIRSEIRVGVPGPAGIRRLLAFAARFGVAASAGIAKKYGLSLTNLMGSAGPDTFINALAGRLITEEHGSVKLHFYTFGGLVATAAWIRDFEARR
ncbi:methylenetetrahydrofolate reductase [Microbacterium terregens]|uniref:Methylenetetrahydrofolate reductase n=1 Tax=Microbacterium terregens TaxID=69363 RepID=A0ABV5T0V7_9MICO